MSKSTLDVKLVNRTEYNTPDGKRKWGDAKTTVTVSVTEATELLRLRAIFPHPALKNVVLDDLPAAAAEEEFVPSRTRKGSLDDSKV